MEIYYVNYPSSKAGYFMTSDHYKYNEIPQDYYLNSYDNSNLINTKFGKAELFLDLAGDNDKLRVGSFSSNSQLFRFNSGREFVVDKLYKDTSKVFEARIELNLNINRLNEEELNTKLDFSVSAAKIRNSSGEMELISFKDLGVEMIKKLSSGGYKLFTDIQNNKSITVSDIYTKYIFGNSNLDNSDKSSNLNLNNSNSNKTINE
ncbi:hypothetical protein [Campylobacter fetus]|uniref:hypothetical protein n=2 Tax=Campylobacter fetus TaxID=196 RepID=UPI0003E30FD2|nr:hypothetical protein [Campylobacter fetus]OCS21769.1 hypothetical protein CFVI97532_08040 [Campylobacter fetus subsp. venerealis cfvi97/532]OCS25971.1 hypothetical protein CFVB10_05640 [Campylobacter fetus subsp. venerealis cfvB10]OCS38182.1 hypothetical protein CFVI02298_10025 [Campylobacter fetus subsp. venerealis cfvi02/298]EAK0835932.1 hypothetical protein [Campylobacter fetus]OCS15734.1 hypothetical protein CfvWBT01109_06515 [Campylobacter fetus subsp. venerealis]